MRPRAYRRNELVPFELRARVSAALDEQEEPMPVLICPCVEAGLERVELQLD